MYTIKLKYNRKGAENQINRIATSRKASLSDSNKSVRIPRKKKDRTGVNSNQKGKKTSNHHSAQRYCGLSIQAGVPDQNYMSHNSEESFGKRSD